jgi:hypothetical protein
MTTTPHSNHPILQPPGKGLPGYELLVARLLVWCRYIRTSREEAAAVFQFEKGEILRLARELDSQVAARPTLIKRLRGLEDSSRFWSVYMTVDHLRIVNTEVATIIQDLVLGVRPQRIATTKGVKPSSLADVTTLSGFEQACNRFEEISNNSKDLRTQMTWNHPWFGELNAQQWHFFAGFHMHLHRRQILAIREKL